MSDIDDDIDDIDDEIEDSNIDDFDDNKDEELSDIVSVAPSEDQLSDGDFDDNDEIDLVDIEYENLKGIESEKVFVPDNRKQSTDFINSTEMTELIGIRARQIEMYNNPLVDVSDLDNPRDMATREFNLRKSPLFLNRSVGIKFDKKRNILIEYIERWDVNQMKRLNIQTKNK